MEYFRNKWIDAGMLLLVAFFIGAEIQRNKIDRQEWGFPFVYHWVIKPEFRFPNQPVSHFSIFLLAINILSLFLAAVFVIFFVSWAIYFVRTIIYKIRA